MTASRSFLDLPRSTPAPALESPPACPKCASKDTNSAAKRPSAQSYWRCLSCGEVWNPSLLKAGPQRWWNR
jgi:hypothetical protein